MNEITVYSKNYCPYCKAAKLLLSKHGLGYKEIEVDKDPHALKEMLKRSHNSRTVPQIFFGDVHIGGYDDLYMHMQSEKQRWLS